MYRIIHGRVRSAAGLIGRSWDTLFLAARQPFGLVGSPIILPYRKFGTSERVRVAGRVVEDRGVVAAAHTDSAAANLWLTVKRFAAYEVPEARVAVRFGVEDHTIVTMDGPSSMSALRCSFIRSALRAETRSEIVALLTLACMLAKSKGIDPSGPFSYVGQAETAHLAA